MATRRAYITVTAAWIASTVAPPAAARIPATGKRADVVSALLGMGYKPSQAERAAELATQALGDEASIDELLKHALRAVH